MKMWMLFVVFAALSWGAYVPTLHQGQVLLDKGSLRAFLCVGMAYFFTAVVVPLILLMGPKMEPMVFNSKGVTMATFAGVLGAAGALFVILALKTGGSPLYVAPLVFAGAPIVNALVSMTWHKPKAPPEPLFWVGMLLAAAGAALVLRFKP